MQVSRDEGSSQPTSLREPCVGGRKAAHEALEAVRAVGVIERRNDYIPERRGSHNGRRQHLMRRYGQPQHGSAASRTRERTYVLGRDLGDPLIALGNFATWGPHREQRSFVAGDERRAPSLIRA